MREDVYCHKCQKAIKTADLPYIHLQVKDGKYAWTGLCCMTETEVLDRYVHILELFGDSEEISSKLLERATSK